MATTKDWTGSTYVSPIYTAYFAGGDASDWCVHTPPKWAKRVTVVNCGATQMYVSKPAISGTAAGAAVADAVVLEPHASGDAHRGGSVTLQLVNRHGTTGTGTTGTATARTFSTFGGDGAAHKIRLIFDHGYGGA